MNQWINESMSIGKTEWSDWGRNGWRVDPSLPVSIRDREGVRGEEGKERFMEGWMDWWIGRPSKFFVVNSLTCVRNEILTGYLFFLPSITYYVYYFKDPGLQKIPQRLTAMVLPNLKYFIFFL